MKEKLLSMFIALLTMVCGANAKSFTTTLWEGTSENDAEINIEASKFSAAKSGDAIRVTFSFTSAGSMHLCYKTGINDDWSAKAFNGISEWPYYSDTNVTTATFVINATDLATLQSYGMYLYGFTSSTITKVEMTGEIPPAGETELLDADWTASWTAKIFAAQSGAKKGDVIRFSYNAPGSWSYFQFNILDAYGNADSFTNTATNVGTSIGTAADLYFDFEITNVSDMEKIQNEGFGIKGDNFTLTSVKLLTYADSYDAVSVTIGSDGIATFSSTKRLDFSGTGVTPYYVSAVATGTVTLTAATDACTWDYCGYILQGAEGTYDVPVTTSASYPSATYLKGTNNYECNLPREGEEDKYIYIFAKDGEDIGFYYLNGKNYTLAAHRAYLLTDSDIRPASGARVALNFDDGDPTAVVSVGESKQDNVYYNLNGMRVTNPSKGVYVVNGKKVIIK
ncbi:MAG: hypothetical protein IKM92_07475 [Bacteroidaceae bacterium]|nr:hypothetical protein [Bacteroidaceae bacterium]